MTEFTKSMQEVIWISPNGKSFKIKTFENGYSQKHIGEVKENPKTTYSASSANHSKKSKRSTHSSSASVSVSQSTKRVQDANDTFTDMGIGGRDITLECLFIGKKNKSEALAFRNALCQTGKSRLQLSFGEEFTVNVLSFEVKSSLIENINTTKITVNFHETSKTTYPNSKSSKKKSIKNAAATAKTSIATNLTNIVNSINSPTRLQKFSNGFSGALNKVSNGLDFANNVTLKSIMTDMMGQSVLNNTYTLSSQLGVVMYKAAALAQKTLLGGDFVGLSSGTSSLFSGWNYLLSELIAGCTTSDNVEELSEEQIDNLAINDSTASMGLISLAESLSETDFETRQDAVEAATQLQTLEQTWTDTVEAETSKITKLENAYIRDDSLETIIAATSNEILEQSYELKIERTITLEQDSTIIDLAYEYYYDDFVESPDDTIDYLIKTNNFCNDEFFLVKRGAQVKLYI